jgi:hypothetical protein
MYSHISKGFTVGQTLMRRSLRNITSIVGLLFDFPMAACWNQGWSDYWLNNEHQMNYMDSTKVHGWGRCIAGYPGDLVGAAVGGLVGATLGLACYIPDIALQGVCALNDTIKNSLDKLATTIGAHELCRSFSTFNPPQNFGEKAWNISVGTIGLTLATTLYAPIKLIEHFLPVGNYLSEGAWRLGGYVGGAIGMLASAAIYPVKTLCNGLVSLYRGFREKMRSLVALIYVKTKEDNNVEVAADCCIPIRTIHSQEFVTKIKEHKASSTAQIIYGAEIKGEIKIAQQVEGHPNNIAPGGAPIPAYNPGAVKVREDSPTPLIQGYNR